jgi:lactate permease
MVAAWLLKQMRLWPVVILMAAIMGGVQYAMAVTGLTPMAAFGAGLAGLLVCILISKFSTWKQALTSGNHSARINPATVFRTGAENGTSGALRGALVSYGSLACLMSVIALVGPVHDLFNGVVIRTDFPQVATTAGFITAGASQIFRPLVHPGASVLIIILASSWVFLRKGWCQKGAWSKAARATWHSASASSLGVITMIGLSMIMDHSGMTLSLARGASQVLGNLFPLVSPLVGILGAFATGSNNNSNVLFAGLQQNAALLLSIDPRVLIAAQTTGGALGSMLAPAKIIVGCSTVGLKSRDGEILRRTVPIGLGIGILAGVAALVLSRL